MYRGHPGHRARLFWGGVRVGLQTGRPRSVESALGGPRPPPPLVGQPRGPGGPLLHGPCKSHPTSHTSLGVLALPDSVLVMAKHVGLCADAPHLPQTATTCHLPSLTVARTNLLTGFAKNPFSCLATWLGGTLHSSGAGSTAGAFALFWHFLSHPVLTATLVARCLCPPRFPGKKSKHRQGQLLASGHTATVGECRFTLIASAIALSYQLRTPRNPRPAQVPPLVPSYFHVSQKCSLMVLWGKATLQWPISLCVCI